MQGMQSAWRKKLGEKIELHARRPEGKITGDGISGDGGLLPYIGKANAFSAFICFENGVFV